MMHAGHIDAIARLADDIHLSDLSRGPHVERLTTGHALAYLPAQLESNVELFERLQQENLYGPFRRDTLGPRLTPRVTELAQHHHRDAGCSGLDGPWQKLFRNQFFEIEVHHAI